jgi:TonB family protein
MIWVLALVVLGCASPSAVSSTAEMSSIATGATGSDVDATTRVYEPHEVDFLPVPLEPISVAYPGRLRRLGLEGDVDCRLVVHSDGRVGGVQVASATRPEFGKAALEAMRLARFRPAVLRGRPVTAYYEVQVRFRLD